MTARSKLVAALMLGLAGCSLLKGNEEIQAVVTQAAAGLSAGEFFARYGAAYKSIEAADGTVHYDWAARLEPTAAGVNSLDDRECKLRLVVDPRGRVATATIVLDTPGRVSSSRCAEVFKGRQDVSGARPRT